MENFPLCQAVHPSAGPTWSPPAVQLQDPRAGKTWLHFSRDKSSKTFNIKQCEPAQNQPRYSHISLMAMDLFLYFSLVLNWNFRHSAIKNKHCCLWLMASLNNCVVFQSILIAWCIIKYQFQPCHFRLLNAAEAIFIFRNKVQARDYLAA